MARSSHVVSLLLAAACALGAPAASNAGGRAPESRAGAFLATVAPHRYERVPVARQHEDPFAKVHLVTSRALYDGGIATHARKTATLRDSLGSELVLAEAQAWQLPEISHGIHERERHCGGYFAFATRAEAEAFLRQDRSRQALQAKALADYAIDNAATVAPWLPQVQEANILGSIRHLSTAWPNRYYASTHGHSAALWIRDTWLALATGRSDVSAELFTACGSCGGQPSVILTVRGSELPHEVVVVGGHLDSISNSGSGNAMNAPGADDDASGIATITEIIRIALADGWRPKRTIKFMGYAAEEVGLRGSNAIAQSFRAQGVEVVGVLQLDMTNYAAGSQYAMRLMTDNSNPTLQDFVARLFDSYLAPLGLTRGYDTCGYACSDHASWTAAGYPAAMMAEPTFFNRLHTTTDTVAYLGARAAVSANFAKLGLAFVGELGKTHVPPPRRRNGAQPLAPATAVGVTASQAPDAAARPAAARVDARMSPVTLVPLLRLDPRQREPAER
ncbi:M20/M25/M40 family metallo-hydrolase [Luteimonas viscosa]|nr:M20/M25/M40 family metallo-hydrolase [Luteimonas viscosa]